MPDALYRLPDAPHIIFMAAMKFGTTAAEHTTWAMNTYFPDGLRNDTVHPTSSRSRQATFIRSCRLQAEARRIDDAMPVGEYAQSALGRERLFEYGSHTFGTPVVLLRLNYACELRYGVLLDIGHRVFERQTVDLSMGMANVIWQGDANSACLQALQHCSSPPLVLNLTGPESLSVRWIATEFAKRFGVEPRFHGEEASTALLSNSSRAIKMFGYPKSRPQR